MNIRQTVTKFLVKKTLFTKNFITVWQVFYYVTPQTI